MNNNKKPQYVDIHDDNFEYLILFLVVLQKTFQLTVDFSRKLDLNSTEALKPCKVLCNLHDILRNQNMQELDFLTVNILEGSGT